jgi:hypothetical protein
MLSAQLPHGLARFRLTACGDGDAGRLAGQQFPAHCRADHAAASENENASAFNASHRRLPPACPCFPGDVLLPSS